MADKSVQRFLEDLKKNNKRSKRRPASQIRISDNMDNHIETPSKVIRVDVKPDKKDVDGMCLCCMRARQMFCFFYFILESIFLGNILFKRYFFL